jgi:hypothetical protein
MAKLALIKPDMVFNLVETVAAAGSLAYFAPALRTFCGFLLVRAAPGEVSHVQ